MTGLDLLLGVSLLVAAVVVLAILSLVGMGAALLYGVVKGLWIARRDIHSNGERSP